MAQGDLSGLEFLATMAFSNPYFQKEIARIGKKYSKVKPEWYYINISKSERKGKTSEEIQEMRKSIYDGRVK